jgi:putative transposase
VCENQAIIIESLAVKTMLKNRKLARAISDAGWSSLALKIAYKSERAGRHFIKLDRFAGTSKTCSCCGDRLDELPLNVRAWRCASCGAEDVNAALNIKRLGILELRAGRSHVSACEGLHKAGHAPAAANEAASKSARAA